MIIVDCEQRTEAWHEARRGVISASNIDQIVTPTGKLSSQRNKYLGKLLAEYFLPPEESPTNKWMQRGIELEPEARKAYEETVGSEIKKVGFVYKDETKTSGCSPDGVNVDQQILLEMKCPAPHTHLVYLFDALQTEQAPKNYIPQMQFQMWVCDAKAVDFFSYCPGLPSVLLSVVRDEKLMEAFDKYIPEFAKEIAQAREILENYGIKKYVSDDEVNYE